ncbi:MAG: hypothetical protein ABI210_15080 [Abditibacteriaceae bacterium]
MSNVQVGIARRDITPPLGTELFGYPAARHGHVINDALNATALVLKSEDCVACIVSLDLAIIDEEEVAAIRAEVEKATGIASENITLCATHTHSGPVTIHCWGWGEKNPEYLTSLCAHVTDAVIEAQRTLQAARVGIGVAPSDVGVNRRVVQSDGSVGLPVSGHRGFNEFGPHDRDLTVVRFEGKNGPLASIVHLGVHATSRGEEPSISRDWPGVMMDRVESLTGAPVLFINGAFGDVAPRMACGGAAGDGAIAAQEAGLRAASDAITAWRSICDFEEMELQTHCGSFELPNSSLPSREVAERELAARAGDENKRGAAGADWNYWNAVLQAHDEPLQISRVFQQTITRLGSLAIVPFAGEIFTEIALRLKTASPFTHTLVAGTSNGAHGYYVTREGYARGGYEPWVARAYGAYLLEVGIDDVLVRENLALLEAMVTT